jgi:hypothetical protein
MDFPGSNLPLQIRFTNPFVFIRVHSWFQNEVYAIQAKGINAKMEREPRDEYVDPCMNL